MMEAIAPAQKVMPSWMQTLKEELTNAVHHELSKIMPAYNQQYSNFQSLNGLPICFYCKRLGHVKKHCRRHSSNLKTQSTAQQQQSTESRETLIVDDKPKTETTPSKVETPKSEEISMQSNNVLVEIGKLFRKLLLTAAKDNFYGVIHFDDVIFIMNNDKFSKTYF